ncbi:MAG: hypothetical protein FWF95_04040 [Syntrophorhabdaceae bacterium]|nr:hypothetical protein [Syntrophorhabdaceae bacterium]
MNCKFVMYEAMFFLLFLSTPVHADWLYKFVVYDCDKGKDLINIKYVAKYNEEGKKIDDNKDENTINPWELVDGDEDMKIVEKKEIVKKCQLSGGNYDVTIGPSPGNEGNVLGRCGASMSAWVSIKKEDKEIYKGSFEGDCHYSDNEMMPREITVIGKTAEILIKKGIQGKLGWD